MGEHKGAITIIIAVLVVFGLFVAFSTDVLDPLLDKIGVAFTKMVDNVFAGSGMPK
ncbi:hypothetical protein ACH0BF_22185 [Pseudobacillus sp. 179-B 2D1 NHS]|uniref:hypothetical protein n=1 Tax=Pseudobacillus sp. 179-B 2D1 NHS TaxID=3374292 RepID=UPI00387A61E1